MEKIKLGDISKLINGDRGKNYPSQADITKEGEIPFVNAGHLNGRNIDFGEMNYISREKYGKLSSGKFQRGDILYCLRGSLGKKAIVSNDIEGAIASSLVVIRPDREKVNGEYLMLALDSPAIKEQLVKANNGSSQPNLSAASVREYDIELPELSVQKEVVERLEKVKNVIDSRMQELQLLDELIKARFVELFGDIISNEKGWKTDTWSNVLKIVNGKNQKAVEAEDGEYLICGSGGAMGRATDYLTNENSVIVGRKGNINKPILMREKYWNVDTAFGIEPNQEFINVDYFYMFCVFFNFEKLNKAVTIPSLTKADLLNIEMPIPKMEVQNQFSDFVKQVDKLKVVVQKALDETQLLFDSLMQKYFG